MFEHSCDDCMYSKVRITYNLELYFVFFIQTFASTVWSSENRTLFDSPKWCKQLSYILF